MSNHRLRLATKRLDGAPTRSAEAGADLVRSVGIVGVGCMGRQIAAVNLASGRDVFLFDASPQAVAEGLVWIKGQTCEVKFPRAKHAQLTASTSLADLRGSDLVLEAIQENREAKVKLLIQLEAVIRPTTLLASNTSSISISELGAQLEHPQRFCGMHFCHPVSERSLVEVVAGRKTQPSLIATTIQYLRSLDRTPLSVADCPGFLVNRLLFPYLSAALELAEEGTSLDAIDSVATMSGMPLGPFAFLDEIGIDVAFNVGTTLYRSFPDRVRPSGLLVAVLKSGCLGKKSGAGFFVYGEPDRLRLNPVVLSRMTAPSATKATLSRHKIQRRLFEPMMSEVRRCVQDSVVSDERDVWRALSEGLGFYPVETLPLNGLPMVHPFGVVRKNAS